MHVSRYSAHIRVLLHNGIVDGDLFANWEKGVGRFAHLSISRHHSVHLSCNLWNVLADGCYQRADVPNEDTGIPEVVASFQILLCRFEIGFLAERSHLMQGSGSKGQVPLGQGSEGQVPLTRNKC